MARKIVLIGGGFSDGEYTDLDQFAYSQQASSKPKVCFIPTASGDSVDYIRRFYAAHPSSAFEATHLELFRRNREDIAAHLSQQDVIYVGGGNTANMLSLWRLHGVDVALRQAYEKGVLLVGISAGAACWFESCLTDSFGTLQPLSDGLGFLRGSFCPHFNSERGRREVFRTAVRDGRLGPGFGLDDGAAALFIEGELAEVRRSSPAANIHPAAWPARH